MNVDEFVNFNDFAALAVNWGQTGGGLDGDLDKNGTINVWDLQRFSVWWLEEYKGKSADFNFDYIVNFGDYAELAGKWFSEAGDGNWNDTYDLDENGVIDIYDLQILADKWLGYEEWIIYVDASAGAGGDGGTWHGAFKYLQDALNSVAVPTTAKPKLYVAEGVYRPDENGVSPEGTGLRTATFQLPEGTAIYGGFPAGGGPFSRRDMVNNETILSGDIGVEDVPTDNCYNVVVSANDVTLDGLTIAYGSADATGDRGRGGGIRNDEVNNVTITNCTFRDNLANYDGGGMYNYKSAVFVSGCVFSDNICGDDGGGVYSSNSEGTFVGCKFIGNWAIFRGGGMYNYESGFELINCLFSGNDADANGGAVFNGYRAVTLINCTIAGNSAAYNGGGVYNTYSASTLANCIVWGNGQAIYNKSAEPHIRYCDIEGSFGSGAGWNTSFGLDEGNNIDADPYFAEGFALQGMSPCIDAGNNFELPAWVTTDITGNARFNGQVDMGAYEYGGLIITQDSDFLGIFQQCISAGQDPCGGAANRRNVSGTGPR